ncbi:MAG TPA: alpha/beta hydrolase-fold protein, partial [Caulobacteraceae bacterium]
MRGGAQCDVTIGPDYPRAPELDIAAPAGRLTAFVMDSRDSALFPGVRRLDNEITRRRDSYGNRLAAAAEEQSVVAPYRRTAWVYAPAASVAQPLPLIIAQDGHVYVDILPRALDVLIDQGRVPPMAAVLIDSGGGDAQGSQRGLEYDTLSGRYSDFVETEVLPRAAREAGLRFTDD